jgi:hypothetical protein
MKLYKLSQSLNNNYDTYGSAVVCAESEEEARLIHPSKFVTHHKDGKWYGTLGFSPHDEYETENDHCRSWVQFSQVNEIEVKYLGEADAGIEKGVVIASFNAG